MSQRKILLLLFALIVGGITVVLARSLLSSSGPNAPQAVAAKPTYEILVAGKDLPAGTILKDQDVKWMVWPESSQSEAYAIKGKAQIADYVGAVVRSGLHADEPIMTGRVVKPGQQGFMAAALTPGMKAVSISLTPVAGVAGFVFPGDRVDVIVTHQIGRKNDTEGLNRRVSETILQNVRVLALDQKMNDQMTEPKVAQTATLEVTGPQAEALALASEIGTVSLALCSIGSETPVEALVAKTPASAEEPAQDGGIAVDAAALALPEAAVAGASSPAASERGMTWDSDISRVLPRPANRSGAVQHITIIRGKESSSAIYDLTSP